MYTVYCNLNTMYSTLSTVQCFRPVIPKKAPTFAEICFFVTNLYKNLFSFSFQTAEACDALPRHVAARRGHAAPQPQRRRRRSSPPSSPPPSPPSGGQRQRFAVLAFPFTPSTNFDGGPSQRRRQWNGFVGSTTAVAASRSSAAVWCIQRSATPPPSNGCRGGPPHVVSQQSGCPGKNGP